MVAMGKEHGGLESLRESGRRATSPPNIPVESWQVLPRAGVDRYEESLRVIGAMLDLDKAGSISVAEVADGFVLRRSRFRHTSVDAAIIHVAHATLLNRGQILRESQPRSRPSRRPGLWSSFAHTHQDFFRALGHELDAAGARNILFDELSEGLLVCYEVTDDAGAAEERRVVLPERDIEQILNDAAARRRDAVSGKPSQFHSTRGATGELAGAFGAAREIWAPMRDGVPYEDTLRRVGRFFDLHGVRRVCALEAPDGFALRYRSPADDQFTWSRLRDEDLQAQGRTGGRRMTFLRLVDPSNPAGYRDLFRTLGAELERERAFNVMVLEHHGDILITYQYLDSGRSFEPRKRLVVVGRNEQIALRQRARSRRRHRSEGPAPRRA